MCTQLPAQPQRKLVLKGTLGLRQTMRVFGYAMPMHAELDEMVRSGRPELTANKHSTPARCGDLFLYPERNGTFPPLFEYADRQTKKKYCIDTRNYTGIRGIALFLPRGTFRFRFDGDKMLFFADKEPLILQFPQHPGWYPYDPRTFIPVSHGGIQDPSGAMKGRFLDRRDDAWLGFPSRSVNMGNNEEKYIFVSDLPSTPRGVFVWEDTPIHTPTQPAEPKGERRIVQVPASAPVSGRQTQDQKGPQVPAPEKPAITYPKFIKEWNIMRALYSLDPSHYTDPGPVPDKTVFEKLLSEGKIKMEK